MHKRFSNIQRDSFSEAIFYSEAGKRTDEFFKHFFEEARGWKFMIYFGRRAKTGKARWEKVGVLLEKDILFYEKQYESFRSALSERKKISSGMRINYNIPSIISFDPARTQETSQTTSAADAR
jgi:hypothetical protein